MQLFKNKWFIIGVACGIAVAVILILCLGGNNPPANESSVSEDSIPEVSKSETSLSETSENDMSESSEASEVSEEASVPEVSLGEASDEISEEESVPEESKPEESKPEESKPEESNPEVSAPEVSAPEVSVPEASEPEASEPEVSEPEETVNYAEIIVGLWSNVTRVYYEEGSDNLETTHFEFDSDGTGMAYDRCYTYYPDMPEGDYADGWSVAGMGYITSYFTYSVEGDKLILYYIPWGSEEDPDYCPGRTEEATLSIDDKGFLSIEFYRSTLFYKGDCTLKELCEAFGVDYTVKIVDPDW